jgi:hypothetical protein
LATYEFEQAPELRVSPEYSEHWRDLTGVKEDQAHQVVLRPDRHESHLFRGHRLTLSVCYRRRDRQPHLLLIITGQAPTAKMATLYCSIRLYQSFASDMFERTPMSLLHVFLERFGRPVKLGNIEKACIFSEVVPTEGKAVHWFARAEHGLGVQAECIAVHRMRGVKAPLEHRDSMVPDAAWIVSLAFGFAYEAYQKYLAAEGLPFVTHVYQTRREVARGW